MLKKLLGIMTLWFLSQLCTANPSDFDVMLCQLEANIALGAAQDRVNGVSLEDSIDSVDDKLKSLEVIERGLFMSITEVMQAKVHDVYFLYSLDSIQKPNFRSYMHGLCLSEIVPPSDPSLPVDFRFVEKMSTTFKLGLAGSVPDELLEKLSQAAALCMLTEYRSESHKAIDEFVTYIADGKPNSDAKRLIMLTYSDDEEAIAAFTRVGSSTRTCVENALKGFERQ